MKFAKFDMTYTSHTAVARHIPCGPLPLLRARKQSKFSNSQGGRWRRRIKTNDIPKKIYQFKFMCAKFEKNILFFSMIFWQFSFLDPLFLTILWTAVVWRFGLYHSEFFSYKNVKGVILKLRHIGFRIGIVILAPTFGSDFIIGESWKVM